MKKFAVSILLMLTSWSIGLCQNVDEEIGFKYVKAEYLYKTDRLEDAIKELNDIIKSEPAYKDALMLRAQTRYQLAAYKGAKEDALKYIDANGITLQAAEVLGKAEYSMNQAEAAINSLTTAIALKSQDYRIYELRAQLMEDKNLLLQACEDWKNAAKMGSTKGAINARKLCGETVTKQESTPSETDTPTTTNPDSEVDETEQANSSTTNPTTDSGTTGEQPSDPSDTSTTTQTDIDLPSDINIPAEDNTPNNIEIDEDLTLSIYGQGLGLRKVLEKPSILMLSSKTGKVTVEICVNENGKVDFAEYDGSKSSISDNSLISLSIRKAKEFWFEKSDYKKQCGYIVFNIKGIE